MLASFGMGKAAHSVGSAPLSHALSRLLCFDVNSILVLSRLGRSPRARDLGQGRGFVFDWIDFLRGLTAGILQQACRLPSMNCFSLTLTTFDHNQSFIPSASVGEFKERSSLWICDGLTGDRSAIVLGMLGVKSKRLKLPFLSLDRRCQLASRVRFESQLSNPMQLH